MGKWQEHIRDNFDIIFAEHPLFMGPVHNTSCECEHCILMMDRLEVLANNIETMTLQEASKVLLDEADKRRLIKKKESSDDHA